MDFIEFFGLFNEKFYVSKQQSRKVVFGQIENHRDNGFKYNEPF
jgi:hypothetical protein